jgi:hypothetical protein
MSHHFDGPTAIQDGRLNLCDAYAFPGQPGNSVLILTVNPDAGRSSATTYRSESVYEFVIGRAADREDLCLRVLFSDPSGAQRGPPASSQLEWASVCTPGSAFGPWAATKNGSVATL